MSDTDDPTISRPGGRTPATGWAPYLEPGERILWEGSAAPGIRVGPARIATSVFGVFFLAFALFWTWGAAGGFGSGSAAPGTMAVIFPLFGVPFILTGLYLTAGQYVWDSYARRHTRYALSNRRAFIARQVFGRSLKSWPLEDDAPLEFEQHGPNEVSVIFAEEVRRGSKGKRYTVRIGFHHAVAGPELFQVFREAKAGL